MVVLVGACQSTNRPDPVEAKQAISEAQVPTDNAISAPELPAEVAAELMPELALQPGNLLQVERDANQDLSNPSNWLTIANETRISEIEKRWNLPKSYLEFLKKYSPLNVYIDNDKFFQGLNL